MKRRSDDQPISRAEKAKLHRKSVATLERRQERDRELQSSPAPSLRLFQQPRPQQCWELSTDINNDFDNDEPYFIEIDEVVTLLRGIERHREALQKATTFLRKWLDGSHEFSDAWHAFTTAGGISADDFDQFARGRFRARRIRQKKHLRLIPA